MIDLTTLARELEAGFSIGQGGLRKWGACVRFMAYPPNGIMIVFQFPNIPNLLDGREGGLEHHESISILELSDPNPKEYMLRRTREALHRFMLHEADECLLWMGRRKWDPHVKTSHSQADPAGNPDGASHHP